MQDCLEGLFFGLPRPGRWRVVETSAVSHWATWNIDRVISNLRLPFGTFGRQPVAPRFCGRDLDVVKFWGASFGRFWCQSQHHPCPQPTPITMTPHTKAQFVSGLGVVSPIIDSAIRTIRNEHLRSSSSRTPPHSGGSWIPPSSLWPSFWWFSLSLFLQPILCSVAS